MDRVAFLIEPGLERIPALLNPESLLVRRLAGLRPRTTAGGKLSGTSLRDDPLLYTGGGHTEMVVDLLFDVNLSGSTILTEDVRDLTRPLWDLTERPDVALDGSDPLRVRFVWGKAWNVLGVIVAVSERLESFTPTGVPRRSWLRLRLVRIDDGEPGPDPGAEPDASAPIPSLRELEDAPLEFVELGGSGEHTEEALAGERLDLLAHRFLGHASRWRWIAELNDLLDPIRLEAGTLLRIPRLRGPR